MISTVQSTSPLTTPSSLTAPSAALASGGSGLESAGTSGPVKNPNAELGKDDFLKLMVTQLRNQDPLNPLDQNQFMAQTAQFSSLEQLVDMNKTLTDLSQTLGATKEPSASLAQLEKISQALDDIKTLLGGKNESTAGTGTSAGIPPAEGGASTGSGPSAGA